MTKEEREELEASILKCITELDGEVNLPVACAALMWQSMDMCYKIMPPEKAFEAILRCAKKVASNYGMEIQTDLRREKIH